MVSCTPIFNGREEYMLSHCLGYRIDCLILEELGRCLKDCPGFLRYDELHRDKWARSCGASYTHGKQLVLEGETLLQSKEVTQDDFLKICCDTQELRTLYKTMRDELSPQWNSFFKLYDMVMSDAGDFEAMYAAFFGVQDAGPSPEFLALATQTIQPSDEIDGSWFPVTQQQTKN